jgi:hypothetical protein
MPVAIDEISTEIVAPNAAAGAAAPATEATPAREKLLRRQRELTEHLAGRAERVRAD